jgi:hypothetical protein
MDRQRFLQPIALVGVHIIPVSLASDAQPNIGLTGGAAETLPMISQRAMVVVASTDFGLLELQAILPNVIRVHVHPGISPTSGGRS